MLTTPTTSPHIVPLLPNASEPLDLFFGEVSEMGISFVPFKLVRQYPYMYVGKMNQKRVADLFKETLLNDHAWDFFSQCDPTARRDPLLLVPTIQFEEYLNVANEQLGIQLAIPRGRAEERFFLKFGEWDTPRPRFLGQANSASGIDALKARAHTLSPDDVDHLTPACYQMYRERVDEVYNSLNASESKKDPDAARRKRMQRQKDNGRMLKRVQRYLGLRRDASYTSFNGSKTNVWDVLKPAPYKTRESVRFVCVDVEAWEKETRTVTEIGLAVLDTEDVMDICPGERGANWFSHIQAHHFRIKERCYMINSEFVQGCPEAFDFGKTQIVPVRDINRFVREVIGDSESEDQRPVIIVGHDVRQDLKYLQQIGYNPWCVPQIVDEVDTMAMFQRIERNPNNRGLGSMCAELGILGYNYHNAGNDAVYTLQAMISIAIKRTVEGSDRKDSFTPGSDEWTDGDEDDGGCPKRSAPPAGKGGASQRNDKARDEPW
ncbi:hypothetical protein NUW58_g4161 [Xylaria curta]|uniref:Uncharacterized protein n=1 Tax=Xylaria curta TaxID=42375 RepID=A0ACC1PAN3_9PEZI|nr:hypothetical protein NUW58_g4161 [Xylaria curta]